VDQWDEAAPRVRITEATTGASWCYSVAGAGARRGGRRRHRKGRGCERRGVRVGSERCDAFLFFSVKNREESEARIYIIFDGLAPE